MVATTRPGEWADRGACRGRPDWVSPDHPEFIGVQAARRLCAGCPVLLACRDWVLSLPQRADMADDITGGWTQPERERRRRNHKRAQAVRARA
jgi:hypothetical protein